MKEGAMEMNAEGYSRLGKTENEKGLDREQA